MSKHVKSSKSKNCRISRRERRVKQRLEDEKRVEEEKLEEIRRLERERKKAEARREREQQVGERRVSTFEPSLLKVSEVNEVIDRLNQRNSYLADQIEEKEKRLKELELKSKIWLAADNWRMDPLEVDSINKYKGDPDETLLLFEKKNPETIEIPLLSMNITINMQDPRVAKRKFQEEVLLIFGSDSEL